MPALNKDLEWAIEDVRARLPRYALYRAYDEGDHRLLFATEKYKNAFGDLFREFADNLCEDVVDSITDRLQIIGWSSTDAGINAAADLVWSRNQGEARSGAIHRNGFREGDGFTIAQVDPEQRARVYKQDPAQMAVHYSTDSPDEMDLAAKVWRSAGRYRVNLYYRDRTERWASRGTGADGGLPRATAFRLLEAGDPALVGDMEPVDDHEDGIPVFHYPNGDLSAYGKSILRGVIPLQDALNKAVADMLVTMEGHAAPLRWARGIEVKRNPLTGEEEEPFAKSTASGGLLRTGSKDAMFGQFDAASLDGFLDVQDSFKIEIARKGVMPPHSITLRSGNSALPSGIALLVAEGRTIKLAKDRQRDWGTEHRREMAYALNLEHGTREVTMDDLECQWAPPETRDMTALLQELLIKKDLGVPPRQLLLEAGYDSDDVEEFLEEAEETQQQEAAVMSVLEGGRQSVSVRGATALQGLPQAPVPPNGE